MTLSMTDETVDRATREALTIAKDNGAVISFDPNYRAPLWGSVDEAKEKMAFGMQNCDVLKISDNEIALLTGKGVRPDGTTDPLIFRLRSQRWGRMEARPTGRAAVSLSRASKTRIR